MGTRQSQQSLEPEPVPNKLREIQQNYVTRRDDYVNFEDSTKDEDVERRMGVRYNEISETSANQFKHLVSKKKVRFVNDYFNLDLAYITKRIIAMGFPAQGFQKLYRNSRDNVISFLTTYHPTHYKIYNLCQERDRFYDNTKFPGAIVEHYPIYDHNPTSILMVFVFCLDAYYYMRESQENVIAVHCKAGKGRTGLMICCFLLFNGTFHSSDEAIKYYGLRRAEDRKGISIPSQIRCIRNFEKYMLSEFGPRYYDHIESMLSRNEYYCNRIKSLLNQQATVTRIIILNWPDRFRNRATISYSLLDKSDPPPTVCDAIELAPGVYEFVASQETRISGDVCMEFKKKKLNFRLWFTVHLMNEGETWGQQGDRCLYEEFTFKKEMEEEEKMFWSPRSLTDFDRYSMKVPEEGVKLRIECQPCREALRKNT